MGRSGGGVQRLCQGVGQGMCGCVSGWLADWQREEGDQRDRSRCTFQARDEVAK